MYETPLSFDHPPRCKIGDQLFPGSIQHRTTTPHPVNPPQHTTEPLVDVDTSAAATAIAPYLHRTPIVTSAYFDQRLSASLFFKCENLQKTGSFKARGAMNAMLSLSEEEAARGVVTHSSGNHGQALAWAAGQRGIKACVVMPRGAPAAKVAAVRDYGAEIVECEPSHTAREVAADEIVDKRGMELIHPFNDPRIVAGQSTCAAELMADVPDLDIIIAPVGGGGLLSGTALSAFRQQNGPRVFAAEPAEADDAYRSFEAGRLIELTHTTTIADGLRTSLGTLTFPVIARHVERIVLVDEDEIIRTMRLVWERMKIVVEPSAAVPLTGLFRIKEEIAGKRVGVIFSGGNVDLDRLPWLTPPR